MATCRLCLKREAAIRLTPYGRPPELCEECRSNTAADRAHNAAIRRVLGARTTRVMAERRFSYRDLARLSGVNECTVSLVCKGSGGTTASVLARLATALGASMDWLCGLTEERCTTTESRNGPAPNAAASATAPTAAS